MGNCLRLQHPVRDDPMSLGGVNDDIVDSIAAQIILSDDVGITAPFPVGSGARPSSVTPPSGCNL
jgi:hypothetical protein